MMSLEQRVAALEDWAAERLFGRIRAGRKELWAKHVEDRMKEEKAETEAEEKAEAEAAAKAKADAAEAKATAKEEAAEQKAADKQAAAHPSWKPKG